MKHWFLSLILLFFFLEVFSVLPHRTSHSRPSSSSTPTNYVSGLINVHTLLSDGYKNIPEITAIAKKLGHSFVVFADQDSLEGKNLGWEKSYEGVDAFIEMESKTPSGDLLVFFSHVLPNLKSPKEVGRLGYDSFLGNQPRSNVFVSVSHPSHVKKPWTQLERFPDGIELFNFDSLFLRRLYSNPIDFIGLAFLYPFNPFITSLRLNQPYSKDLSNWDNMNTLGRGHFGFFSSQFTPKVHLTDPSFDWPSHEEIFQLGSNIVYLTEALSNDFQTRKRQIYRSIQEGRIALTFPSLFPFEGNDSQIKCGETVYRSGDSINRAQKECVMQISLPSRLPYAAQIRLIRNGELDREIRALTPSATLPITKSGTYRVEIWLRPHSLFWILLRKWVPYVFYNPIFVS